MAVALLVCLFRFARFSKGKILSNTDASTHTTAHRVLMAFLVVVVISVTTLCSYSYHMDRHIESETPVDSTSAPSKPASGDTVALNIKETISSMTLKEKISQMVIVRPETITGNPLSFTTEGAQNLKEYPFGGICFFAENISNESILSAHILAAQKAAADSGVSIPLFISIDEEGGGLVYPDAKDGVGGIEGVSRLSKAELTGTQKLYPPFYYKDKGTQVAKQNAEIIASYLKEYGFNWDYAPVADTNSNPDNPIIGYRAYADDWEQCAELVAAAVEGFEDKNMACSLKHFPGHGDTETDTHLGSAYVDKSYEQMKDEELAPFASGIASGADSVMMGHIIVEDVSPVPASISKEWIDILRDDMDFQGVVVTDGLEMGAVSQQYSAGELAVKCVEAGEDVLLLPEDPYAAVDAVVAAVESGQIDEGRIDKSVERILAMKSKHGIWAAGE